MAGMDDAPISATDARNLRFLRVLVTVLTVTMIVGLLTIVVLLVIRFSAPPAELSFQLPETITLPKGTHPTAITRGSNWFAVVTSNDQILIFDATSGKLRQTVQIQN